MKRFDLRPLKDDFYDRMFELLSNDIKEDENAIFLFEIGDFSPIQKVADLVKENEYILMNSLKFNEVDWTVVIKKTKPEVAAVEEDKTEEDAKASSES